VHFGYGVHVKRPVGVHFGYDVHGGGAGVHLPQNVRAQSPPVHCGDEVRLTGR